MNKFKLTILFSVLSYSAISWAQYQSREFKLGNHTRSKALEIHKIVEKDTTLFIDIPNDIKALYVSGHISLFDDLNSYLRIVLQDCNDMEYLVYETYSLISESKESDFINTALETKFLEGVRPKCLKIKAFNSRLRLDGLTFVEGRVDTWKKRQQLESEYRRQVSSVVDILNNQLRTRNSPWRAGVTDVSLMTYEEKKLLFGGDVPMLAGLEHYKTGVFLIPDFEVRDSIQEKNTSDQRSAIDMVKEWDWRNRHGKNWLTPAKWQGNCGACWAFATIGFLETYINLYYNRLLNYDLSEQELVTCCSGSNGCKGGYSFWGFYYARDFGVVMDTCFVYSNPSHRDCSEKCSNPNEVISLNELSCRKRTTEEDIKSFLFQSPVTAVVEMDTTQHEMLLVGYRYLEMGDTIVFTLENFLPDIHVINDSTLAGKTAWLFKNSGGESWGENGFGFFTLNCPLISVISVDAKVSSLLYDDNYILATDEDGDGYYFWGVGRKPSTLPAWILPYPDGDDSNENYGPIISSTGELTHLDPVQADTIEITTNTLWNSPHYYCQNVLVKNGGTLEITDEIGFHKDCVVEVMQGGNLILNGGSIYNATVIVRAGGEGHLENDGKIIGRSENTLVMEQGAVFEMVSGEIKQYNR